MTIFNKSKRLFMAQSVKVSALASLAAILPSSAFAAIKLPSKKPRVSDKRYLSLYNPHTNERVRACFFENGRYNANGLRQLDILMRDHRQNKVHPMATKLVETLYEVQRGLHGKELHIISGYRTPKTNAMLRRRSGNVAKNSYHMRGMAVDVRVPGTPTKTVRNLAKAQRSGGVGWYPRSGFVHMDTGPIRYW